MERTIFDEEGDSITVASVATDPGQITVSAEEGGSGCYFVFSERTAIRLALAIMEAVEDGNDLPSFALQELRDMEQYLPEPEVEPEVEPDVKADAKPKARSLSKAELEIFEAIDSMLVSILRKVTAYELFGMDYTVLSRPLKALVDIEVARKG